MVLHGFPRLKTYQDPLLCEISCEGPPLFLAAACLRISDGPQIPKSFRPEKATGHGDLRAEPAPFVPEVATVTKGSLGFGGFLSSVSSGSPGKQTLLGFGGIHLWPYLK